MNWDDILKQIQSQDDALLAQGKTDALTDRLREMYNIKGIQTLGPDGLPTMDGQMRVRRGEFGDGRDWGEGPNRQFKEDTNSNDVAYLEYNDPIDPLNYNNHLYGNPDGSLDIQRLKDMGPGAFEILPLLMMAAAGGGIMAAGAGGAGGAGAAAAVGGSGPLDVSALTAADMAAGGFIPEAAAGAGAVGGSGPFDVSSLTGADLGPGGFAPTAGVGGSGPLDVSNLTSADLGPGGFNPGTTASTSGLNLSDITKVIKSGSGLVNSLLGGSGSGAGSGSGNLGGFGSSGSVMPTAPARQQSQVGNPGALMVGAQQGQMLPYLANQQQQVNQLTPTQVSLANALSQPTFKPVEAAGDDQMQKLAAMLAANNQG